MSDPKAPEARARERSVMNDENPKTPEQEAAEERARQLEHFNEAPEGRSLKLLAGAIRGVARHVGAHVGELEAQIDEFFCPPPAPPPEAVPPEAADEALAEEPKQPE